MDDPGNERELVNHVPDEICVVVQARRGADPRALYDEVGERLNDDVRRLATRPSSRAARRKREPLEEDLEPDEALETLTDYAEPIFRSMVREGLAEPWVDFDDDRTDADTWHFYYRLGPDRVSFSAAALDERVRRLNRVRELTNLVNAPALGISGTALARGRWAVRGAAPNWLMTAAPFSCGSPAAVPVPEPRGGRWHMRLGESLEAALDEPPTADVIVVVLDTSPDLAQLGNHPNKHLSQLVKHLTDADGAAAIGLQEAYFQAPNDVDRYWDASQPWWQERMPDEPDPSFAIPDHGLFVAGIVRDLAPDARVRLIRVLNDSGVGDLLALDRVLRQLPGSLLGPAGERKGKRLIVNLSLGAAVPVPPRRAWKRWLPRTFRQQDDGVRLVPRGRAKDVLDASHANLRNTMRWLTRQGVLVVAAAGNDALRAIAGDRLPPPRYPAFYEDVLAVAAAGPDGQPAAYSNRGDVPPLNNGITTFGGDVVPATSSDAPARTDDGASNASGRPSSIAGLYSAESLPGGARNSTGWVRWAGTSFAAPVVAGVAARLLASHPELTPQQTIDRIRSFARDMPSGRPADPDPDGPLDAPVLDAYQELVS